MDYTYVQIVDNAHVLSKNRKIVILKTAIKRSKRNQN